MPSDGPGSPPLYGFPLKFACLLLSLSPNEVAVFVPARQAYSHWASVGSRNSHSFGRVRAGQVSAHALPLTLSGLELGHPKTFRQCHFHLVLTRSPLGFALWTSH